MGLIFNSIALGIGVKIAKAGVEKYIESKEKSDRVREVEQRRLELEMERERRELKLAEDRERRELKLAEDRKRTEAENQRRRSNRCVFQQIQQSEFAVIALRTIRKIPQITEYSVVDATVFCVEEHGTNQRVSFEIDYNDYGKLTGNYWISGSGAASETAKIIAAKIKSDVVRFPACVDDAFDYEVDALETGETTAKSGQKETVRENKTRYCQYCGNPIDSDNARFCAKCGKQL